MFDVYVDNWNILFNNSCFVRKLYNEVILFLLNLRRFDDFEYIVYYVLYVKIIYINVDISVIIV